MLEIAAAKARGVYRKESGEAHNKKHSDAAILEFVAAGRSVSQIAKIIGCSESPLLGRRGRRRLKIRCKFWG